MGGTENRRKPPGNSAQGTGQTIVEAAWEISRSYVINGVRSTTQPNILSLLLGAPRLALDLGQLPDLATKIFVGSVGGVVGAIFTIFVQSFRNRPGLKAYLVQQERLYVRMPTPGDAARCESADASDPDTILLFT